MSVVRIFQLIALSWLDPVRKWLGDVQPISIVRTQTNRTDTALPDHRRTLADVLAGEFLQGLRVCSSFSGVRKVGIGSKTRVRNKPLLLAELYF
jgi:hypothetical protein